VGKFAFPEFETERLVLRLLAQEDSAAVYRHFAEEEVTRYLDIPSCKDIGEAGEIIRFHIEDPGCRWGLFLKETGQLAGTCGYHCWDSGPSSKAEIGFDLSEAYWGQGLMTEATVPVIQVGFEQMGLQMIEATVEPANQRSKAMLDRLGFKRKAELVDNLVYFYLLNPR
jgi:ribosomal-protein-alanine N-acetyltransferase